MHAGIRINPLVHCFYIMIFNTLQVSTAHSWVNDTMKVSGEFNSWNNSANPMSQDTLAREIWKLTVQISNSDHDEFIFNNWGWDNKWVDGGTAKNTPVFLTWRTGGGANNAISSVQANYYYTFRIADNGYANTTGIVMETSSNPVGITWTGDSISNNFYASSRSYVAGSNYLVYCTLSAARPPEQKIYVRYTLDNWASANLQEITTGSQTTLTGTFVLSYGSTMKYYLMTSTLSAGATLADNADLCTLTHDTRGGNNFEVFGALANTHTAFIPGQYTAPGLSWGFGIFNQFQPTLLYGGNSNYWSCTVYHVTNNHEFKITFGPGWATNWGANSTSVKLSVAPDATNTGYRLSDSANMEFNGSWGNGAVAHITCYIPQDGNDQLAFGVKRLTAAPTVINTVTDSITSPSRQRQAGVSTVVSAQVSRASLLAEEKLFLRYSSNNWANHFVVPMTKEADNLYVATLPAMGGSEANVITTEYYVLSSTLSEAALAAGNNQFVDLLTVAYKVGPNDKNFVIYGVPEPAAALLVLALAAARMRKK